jgi:hypothetical protein
MPGPGGGLREFDLAVIVAVVAVRVMKVAIHEIIYMIAMRNRFVAASGAVHMSRVVAATRGGAAVGIFGADIDDVFIDVPAFHMIQMPIVQVIDMPFVNHCDAAGTCAICVTARFANFGVVHKFI